MFGALETRSYVFLRRALAQGGQYRFYGVKKKFAVTLRYKEGRQLALEHFDFYYKPIFRQRWPSIRLGLTSRSKSCAMVNNFGTESETFCAQFESARALDLVKLLEEAKAKRMEKKNDEGAERRARRRKRPAISTEPIAENEPSVMEEDSRSEATMNEFVQPTKYITRDTVPDSHKVDDTLPILDTWNPDDVEIIKDEDIEYPKHLRVFAYPMGDITKFDDSMLDERTAVRSHQMMDASALFPVFALDVRPNDTVLDLCSAPGVKALALLQTLIPCNLVCNDMYPSRVNLLRHNLGTYIQEDDEATRGRIRFLRLDASHLPDDQIGAYDKVLVDVPNNEDRKNLRTPDGDGNIFRRRLVTDRLRLPDQQTAILVGGLKALRRGGSLVYTTSTLSPSQNDEVVEASLRELRNESETSELEFVICDLEPMAADFYNASILRFARGQCRYGQLVIPFLPNNYGPVYTCKLRRVD